MESDTYGEHGMPGGQEMGMDVVARRAEVVRRLAARGMSTRLLQALFPGWDDVITAAGLLPEVDEPGALGTN